MGERDAVTILRTPHGERANKLYKANDDGFSIDKDSAPPRGHYIAQQVPVADCEALAQVLREIGEKADHVLCPGLFKDAPEDEFLVLPRLALAQHLGVDRNSDKVLGWHEIDGVPAIARLKDNMGHGSFTLFDRDGVPGMPVELADLDLDGWLAAMARILPPFARAAKVVLPSSSTRLLIDGEREQAEAGSLHCYVQIADPDELDRVWPQLLVQAFHVDLGFMRPKLARDGSGVVVAEQAWSIYDPSTCSPERLVFDGAPTLIGDWLSLAPCEVEVIQGGRLDLSEFGDLPKSACTKAWQKGIRLETEKRGGNGRKRITRRCLHNATLRLDLEVETGQGFKTIRQLWIEGGEHVRCQSPFRESSSWAAFVSFFADGSPFLHDSGTSTNYVLTQDDALGPSVDEFLGGLDAWLGGCERITDPDDIKTAYGYARRIVAAAARRDWQKAEQEALAATIAEKLYRPFGLTRSRMATHVVREVRSAMKAAASGAETLTDEEKDDILEELNGKFAFVLMGGKARIVEPAAYDPCLDRHYLLPMGPEDFSHSLGNRVIMVPSTNGSSRPMPLARWWLGHPERRQYLGGVVCDPTERTRPEFLNLWQGFNVEPAPGDVSIFLEHLQLVASSGGQEALDYLMRWLAYKVQNPGDKMDVALVLQGGRGVGKSVLGHMMLKIFGTHAMHISQGEQLVGKFNSHLMDCCFVFGDEAFFAGDRRHISVLKALITEPTIVIEPKGVNAFQMRNRVGLLLASNEEWVVSAARDERRYFVLGVPDDRQNNRPYFDRLWKTISDKRALGAFLDHLLKIDLSEFEIRDIPRTKALDAQKIRSLDANAEWLVECLTQEWVCREEKKWKDDMKSGDVYGAYTDWCRSRSRERYMLNITSFGKWLMGIYERQRSNGSSYRFGPIGEARAQFETWAKLEGHEW